MEASTAEERRDAFIDLSRLTLGEPLGMVAALTLGGSLWLPWFSTSSSNEHSVITSAKVGPGETATAWQTFSILKWALLAACIAPFILTWIIARGHKLTWKPGEVTMIVGIVAFMLILCNGIILGRPGDSVAIGLAIGYFVALLASLGLLAAGYLRQAVYETARKPPGVI